ncbi:MAG: response regulator transcription factor [Actinomycetota bacterium]|nr:response regulator transcription factor [Actinomycetota bacterium]
MPIRVLIVDDQALVRAGFHVLLDAAPDIDVIGEAENGIQAIELAEELAPDVILMDIRMPRMDGLEATQRILADDGEPSEDPSAPRVLVLTTFDADEYVYEALRVGASGFLLKDTDPVQLVEAIRVVAQGDALLAPSVTRRLIREFASRPEVRRAHPEALEALTEREHEILSLVAQGLSNDEIAGQLFISPATAKTHVSRVMMKLHARDRAQLVVMAYESGLVVPGPPAE